MGWLKRVQTSAGRPTAADILVLSNATSALPYKSSGAFRLASRHERRYASLGTISIGHVDQGGAFCPELLYCPGSLKSTTGFEDTSLDFFAVPNCSGSHVDGQLGPTSSHAGPRLFPASRYGDLSHPPSSHVMCYTRPRSKPGEELHATLTSPSLSPAACLSQRWALFSQAKRRRSRSPSSAGLAICRALAHH